MAIRILYYRLNTISGLLGSAILLALSLAACVHPISPSPSRRGPSQISATSASLSLPSVNVAPLPTSGPPTPTPALSDSTAPATLPALPSAGLPSATPPSTALPSGPPTETPDLSQMGRDSWLSLSPDGVWQAEVEV